MPAKKSQRELESRLLLLVLMYEAEQKGLSHLSFTQIHKFMFLSERTMWRKNILATGLRFIKMPQGPWSSDIKRMLSHLRSTGFIRIQRLPTMTGDDAVMANLSEEGRFISECAKKAMLGHPDKDILESLTLVLAEYGDMSSNDLADLTHQMKNLVTGRVIDEIEHGKYILKPKTKKKAELIFDIDKDVEVTFEIMLDPESKRSIERSIESARKGPMKVHSSLDDLEAL